MIPVVVVCYNNYKYVQNTVRQLGKFTDNIIIMDNASTDSTTCEYLASCGLDVRYNKTNNGPWIDSERNKHIWDILPDEFVLTDPDLEFNENLPNDFIERLSAISNKYHAKKTGFALRIDDFEDMYQCAYCDTPSIKVWETEFWKNRIQDDEYELYEAGIDTTFALVNKKYFGGKSIRVAGNFTARHIPWYVKNPFYTKEEIMSQGGNISSISIVLRNAG